MSELPIVMIVDDNPGDVDLIRLALEDTGQGMEVITAFDGKEGVQTLNAMSAADRSRCRLILLDLNMPRMNGRDFLAWLRLQPEFKAVPVVILTSSTIVTERAECMALGASDFWYKAPKFDQLQRQVLGVRPYLAAEGPGPADLAKRGNP